MNTGYVRYKEKLEKDIDGVIVLEIKSLLDLSDEDFYNMRHYLSH